MSVAVLRVVLRTVLRIVWHLRVVGVEHLPAHGPYILAANHPSELDPILLAVACPRQLFFVASTHLQALPTVFWFIRHFGRPIWVRRGLADVGAIKTCLAHLAAGEVLVIFPEGRVVQEDQLGAFHSGIAFLAMQADVPVVPIAIRGAGQMLPLGVRWPRPAQLQIRVGELLHAKGQDTMAETFTATIRTAIDTLLANASHA